MDHAEDIGKLAFRKNAQMVHGSMHLENKG